MAYAVDARRYPATVAFCREPPLIVRAWWWDRWAAGGAAARPGASDRCGVEFDIRWDAMAFAGAAYDGPGSLCIDTDYSRIIIGTWFR